MMDGSTVVIMAPTITITICAPLIELFCFFFLYAYRAKMTRQIIRRGSLIAHVLENDNQKHVLPHLHHQLSGQSPFVANKIS